jgi:hypothetical protein
MVLVRRRLDRRSTRAAQWLLLAVLTAGAPADAGVVVLCNRTKATVSLAYSADHGEAVRHDLTPRDVLTIPAQRKVAVAFRDGQSTRRVELAPSSIHGFFAPEKKLGLLPLLVAPPPEGEPEPVPPTPPPIAKLAEVPVKILTDDEEATLRRVWEPLLRKRLAKASELFERQCRVRFKVVAVETWDSDDRIDDFRESFKEFVGEIDPQPAELAIGFTSQYRIRHSGDKLGGTQAPLHRHILICEWVPQMSEQERLEVLLHELGHFLGAAHAPEFDSVMRPNLADRRARLTAFRVGFDPFNTFIMYLLAEELRTGKYRGFHNLHPQRKTYVRLAYLTLAEVFPDDPSPQRYLALLDGQPGLADGTPASEQPADEKPPRRESSGGSAVEGLPEVTVPGGIRDGARQVLHAITEAARDNQNAGALGDVPLRGDRLTEHLVRRAADAAAELPEDLGARALLVGLGIGLDDSKLLRRLPVCAEVCRAIEPDDRRRERIAVLGSPTMRGRRDLAQHFFVSAGLAALVGAENAESAGLLKELADSRGGSGFSFADLAADLAGVAFAVQLRAGRLKLPELAGSFAVEDFLPPCADLPEGIPWEDFSAKYMQADGAAFEKQRTAIRRRVESLPAYQKMSDGETEGLRD